MAKNEVSGYPTEQEVEQFELLEPLVQKAMEEMREFAKKKQDGVVNELKVKLLNRLMTDVRQYLAKEPSAKYLDELNAESLPQNSDAVLVLSQYEAAMGNFKDRFHKYVNSEGKHMWLTQEFMKGRGGVTLR